MRQHSNTRTPEYFYNPDVRVGGVYSITCVTTGKVYVGSAVDISLRWRSHFGHLNAGSHHCKYLQNAWRKYGSEEFSFAVVERFDGDELRALEQFHIDSIPKSLRFNSSPTAGSLLGFKMGPESLERMRIAHTGFRHSEETKARARIARAGICPRPAGWKQSAEARQKVSAARKGKPLSPEHRAKSIETLRRVNAMPHSVARKLATAERRRSLSNDLVLLARGMYLAGKSMEAISLELGAGDRKTISRAIRGVGIYASVGESVTHVVKRPLSEEQRKILSEKQKGRPKSAETRQKMSAFQKGRPKSEGHRERMREARAIRKAALCH